MRATLRSAFALSEDTKEPALREIRLTLAKDTTATHCGRCPRASMTGECFGFYGVSGAPRTLGKDNGGFFIRRAECIAAEVRP